LTESGFKRSRENAKGWDFDLKIVPGGIFGAARCASGAPPLRGGRWTIRRGLGEYAQPFESPAQGAQAPCFSPPKPQNKKATRGWLFARGEVESCIETRMDACFRQTENHTYPQRYPQKYKLPQALTAS